jgi:hypothetical protein
MQMLFFSILFVPPIIDLYATVFDSGARALPEMGIDLDVKFCVF